MFRDDNFFTGVSVKIQPTSLCKITVTPLLNQCIGTELYFHVGSIMELIKWLTISVFLILRLIADSWPRGVSPIQLGTHQLQDLVVTPAGLIPACSSCKPLPFEKKKKLEVSE